MVDYDFYTNSYLGSTVPEKAFPGTVTRAAEYLELLRRRFRVESAGETSEKMALCAMAEQLYQADRSQGVRSASIGSVSVSYSQTPAPLIRRLLHSAGIYLDIYRGVG